MYVKTEILNGICKTTMCKKLSKQDFLHNLHVYQDGKECAFSERQNVKRLIKYFTDRLKMRFVIWSKKSSVREDLVSMNIKKLELFIIT